MTIIDAHHQGWDLAVRDQPWISGDQVAAIRRTFTVDDLRLVLPHQLPAATVMSLARSLVASLSDAERAAVLGGTAARVYQLRGGEAPWH
jgi:predicted TIM-barrel fold metal-dependent hydrolase